MKTLNLKCTFVAYKGEPQLILNRLYKGRIDDEGNYSIVNNKRRIYLSIGLSGEIFLESDGMVIARFIELQTKTIKCTYVDHSVSIKKTFKPGRRYKIEQGRALGGVAGYVFDEEGDRFTLYREEVGFSAGGAYLFEAKYS